MFTTRAVSYVQGWPPDGCSSLKVGCSRGLAPAVAHGTARATVPMRLRRLWLFLQLRTPTLIASLRDSAWQGVTSGRVEVEGASSQAHTGCMASDRWFSEGAEVARRLDDFNLWESSLPASGECYPCPSCQEVYPREKIEALCVEHVPAASLPGVLGGKPLLLTCKTCNGEAGRHFDADAITRARIHKLSLGRDPGRAMRAEFNANGAIIRGVISHSGESMELRGVPAQNSPQQITSHLQELDKMWASGADPSFTVRATVKFAEWRANVSLVRSAYLAAFAEFGWNYAFRSTLDPLRHQLVNPEVRSLPRLVTIDVNSADDRRGMMLVKTPQELRSLLVVIGNYATFLPGVNDPLSCQELAEGISQWTVPGSEAEAGLRGEFIPWPDRPRYRLDRYVINRLSSDPHGVARN